MSSEFKDFGLDDRVRRPLDEAGYIQPTPIQAEALPILLEGKDLIGVAETGTGKTLAFLLPIFQRLEADQRDPQGLVVCPTRELAQQVGAEAERFGRDLGVRTVVAYGGTSSGDQKRQLAAGCDLVVGTPGRLLDFVNSAWLSMRKMRFVVLDEADRMLDMGFITDVDAILRRSPMSRQTMLFSATVSEDVRRLADRYMFHPEIIRMHTGTRVTSKVDHAFYPVHSSRKEDLLLAILEKEKPEKFLVFTATREATSQLALVLRRRRHEVMSLSSLHSQANRERALEAFRRGECRALVATDVAARGLDVTDIDLVVNFDVPMQPEDYVHRIGRTGRAARTGRAITLVSELDQRRAKDIERLLGEDIPRIELEGFARGPRTGNDPRRREGASSGRPRGSGGASKGRRSSGGTGGGQRSGSRGGARRGGSGSK
jgi:ATP-dependent RNA helicase RhlE